MHEKLGDSNNPITCWGDVNLFGCARDALDGAHEDVGHDAHAQEAVEQREEVDGSPDLSRPCVLKKITRKITLNVSHFQHTSIYFQCFHMGRSTSCNITFIDILLHLESILPILVFLFSLLSMNFCYITKKCLYNETAKLKSKIHTHNNTFRRFKNLRIQISEIYKIFYFNY